MKRAVRAGTRRIEYELIRQARKDILLKVLPEGVIRVYAPSYAHLRAVDDVVRARADELERLRGEVDRAWEKTREANALREGRTIWLEGKPYALQIRAGRPSVRFADGVVTVCAPDPADEEALRGQLRAQLSGKALRRIRERLDCYIPRVGRQPGRVTIREQKTRWGSCSSRGNLNFNWKLIMAPPPVLDYVVIHELCHLYEFNHSPRFWQLVEAQMPEYESWKKWLKQHGAELTL